MADPPLRRVLIRTWRIIPYGTSATAMPSR